MGQGNMTRSEKESDKRLDEVTDLLRCLVAIELWHGGVSQAEIGSRLGIAAGSVNKYLKGVKRRISKEQEI